MNKWQAFRFQTKGKRTPRAVQNKPRHNNVMMVKVTVILSVLILGIVLFLVCIYGILPEIISSVDDQLDMDMAAELYELTVTHEPISQSAAEVFEQPQTGQSAQNPRDCFADALKENPDVIGRIFIEGLNIAYVVTQTDDNDYYLKNGYDRRKSRSGTIYMDYRCDNKEPLKGHYILYGHNMKNGTMFHNLKKYAEEDDFKNNRTIYFDTLYADHEWEVFSAYVTSTDFNYIETSFENDDKWLEFINELQKKSLYPTDVTLSANDVVLTLSTCSYEFSGARFVVHARLVKND